MILKRFRFQVILRILVICVLIFFLLYLISHTSLYATIIFIGVLIIYQIIALIRYTEITNRRLTQFLQSIRYADFSQTFTDTGLGKSYSELNRAFSDVISDFQKVRSEKEENYQYLRTLIQHVGIALIVYHKDGKVELTNPATKKLFQISQLHHIRNLKSVSPSLVQTLENAKAGDTSLVKIIREGEILQLAVNSMEFRLRNQHFTLVSLQDIQNELEEREMDAWQKLIRVLTHEIMNSVTPISSLAATVNHLISELPEEKLSNENSSENLQDISEAIQTIQKRSEGLLHFVEAYRSLTRLPQPKFKEFPVKDLFGRLKQLTEEEMKTAAIGLNCDISPKDLKLTADPEQMEQVLINLLKNAIEVLREVPEASVILKAYSDDRGRVVIQVIDNGPGIPVEIQEKIFIPFFTTKKEGSGIGLSLSRQIIRLHKGTISVSADQHAGTIFTIKI